MTKHIHQGTTATGEAVTIETGWERGRQCFFVTLYAGQEVRYDSDVDLRFFPVGMTLEDGAPTPARRAGAHASRSPAEPSD